MSDPRRKIPGVDRLLEDPGTHELIRQYPRARVVASLRRAIEEVRAEVGGGGGAESLEETGRYVDMAALWLAKGEERSLRPVINATGVILHTNLGRAPLAAEALDAMAAVSAGYANLEFDLEEGVRGSRYDHCVSLLTELTGAEAALVVNNGAAALILALNTVALGARVVVSRGELVEIGGGFRIPEIVERAGATLQEVGATNRTRVGDYAAGIEAGGAGGQMAAVLKVHRSNFRMTGFTESVEVKELASLAAQHGLPLVHDLGSGLLIDPAALGLPPETRPSESLSAGADVVVFSGDKLMGGPQAGLVVGSRALVERMKKNPLCRALRVDKSTLAALEATLRLYRDPDVAMERIPILRMLGAPAEAVQSRADSIAAELTELKVATESVPTKAVVGGGTYPGVEIESWGVRIASETRSAADLARSLRAGSPSVVPRVEDGQVVCDLRSVLPEDDPRLVIALERAATDV